MSGASMQEVIAEIQVLLGNAEYLGDGEAKVLTQDLEALQTILRKAGHTPNEPKTFAGADPIEEDCDCADRSWYGTFHDSACPLAGKVRK